MGEGEKGEKEMEEQRGKGSEDKRENRTWSYCPPQENENMGREIVDTHLFLALPE